MWNRLRHTIARMIALPNREFYKDVQEAALSDYESAPTVEAIFDFSLDLRECAVLDVGCGLGGKTLYYCEKGARQVTGVEISEKRAMAARQLVATHSCASNIQIIVADAARLPFRSGTFDRIMSTDTWEHLKAPGQALRDCERVLVQGGAMYISALPYFSPWGAHAWRWLPVPWLQLLIPRTWLFRVLAWLEERRHINHRLPDVITLDWKQPGDPAHARRLTVVSLEKDVAASGLLLQRFQVIPIAAWLYLPLSPLLYWLVTLPWLRECLCGLVVVVARKPR